MAEGKKVLVVIDMQEDFVNGSLGSEQARAVVSRIRERLKEYAAAGNPVLFTMDTHSREDYGDHPASVEASTIPPHCIRGEAGWEIVEELRPYAGDNRVEKPSFLSLDLPEALGRDVAEIELCGVCTDICVISNALHLRAQYPAARIAVREDCCAGTSEEAHNAALLVMKSCVVEVL